MAKKKEVVATAEAPFDLRAYAKQHEKEAMDLFVTAMRQKTSLPTSRLDAAGKILDIANGTLNGEVTLVTLVDKPKDSPASAA